MKKSLLIGLVIGLMAVPTLAMAGGPRRPIYFAGLKPAERPGVERYLRSGIGSSSSLSKTNIGRTHRDLG